MVNRQSEIKILIWTYSGSICNVTLKTKMTYQRHWRVIWRGFLMVAKWRIFLFSEENQNVVGKLTIGLMHFSWEPMYNYYMVIAGSRNIIFEKLVSEISLIFSIKHWLLVCVRIDPMRFQILLTIYVFEEK